MQIYSIKVFDSYAGAEDESSPKDTQTTAEKYAQEEEEAA